MVGLANLYKSKAFCVAKKLLYTIYDAGHPHEMVFVEPSHVFLGEMIGNHNDHLVLELRSPPGVSEVTISVVTLFTLTSEISAKIFRAYSLGKCLQG